MSAVLSALQVEVAGEYVVPKEAPASEYAVLPTVIISSSNVTVYASEPGGSVAPAWTDDPTTRGAVVSSVNVVVSGVTPSPRRSANAPPAIESVCAPAPNAVTGVTRKTLFPWSLIDAAGEPSSRKSAADRVRRSGASLSVTVT